MMRRNGTWRYTGYRGRRSGKNFWLIVLLALVILAAGIFFFAQRHRVYRADGSSRYELPWSGGLIPQRAADDGEDAQDLEVVIKEPDGTQTVIKEG